MSSKLVLAQVALTFFCLQSFFAAEIFAETGAVIGKVSFEQLPEELKQADNQTPAQKAKSKILNQTVIWISTDKSLPVPEKFIAKPKQITQGGGDFHPAMIAAIAGQTVNMPNNDHIIHSVYSRSRIGPFDLGTYPAGESRAVKFAKPGLAMIRCKLHANMIARVVVVPNHYYAVVSPDEPYRIEGLPAGDYKLSLWRSGFVKRSYPLTIEPGKNKTLGLSLRSIAASRKAKTSSTDFRDNLIYPHLSLNDETLSPIWKEESIQLVSGTAVKSCCTAPSNKPIAQ